MNGKSHPDPVACLCIMIHNVKKAAERNSGKLIRMLQKDSWVHVATRGSQRQLTHPVKPGRDTVPHPNRGIPRGTVASIYRQAGWNT